MKKDDWFVTNNLSHLKVFYQKIDNRQHETDPRETMEEAAQWLIEMSKWQYLKSENRFGGKYAGTKRK